MNTSSQSSSQEFAKNFKKGGLTSPAKYDIIKSQKEKEIKKNESNYGI
jgi:hypothetical protein